MDLALHRGSSEQLRATRREIWTPLWTPPGAEPMDRSREKPQFAATSIAVLATAPQPAHRRARGVEALAPRWDRRQPEVNPQDQSDPRVRSPVGARSARSADGEISPRARGVLAHADLKRCSSCMEAAARASPRTRGFPGSSRLAGARR